MQSNGQAQPLAFHNFDNNIIQRDPSFEDITYTNIDDLKTKLNDYENANGRVLNKVKEMEQELQSSHTSMSQFASKLSLNLTKYAGMIDNIETNVKKVFNLIRKLNLHISSATNNEDLITRLVNIINVYLKQFNALENNITTVKNSSNALESDLNNKSQNLFGKIDNLNNIFQTQFQQLGIFNINGNLYTYAEIQKALRDSNNSNIKPLFYENNNLKLYEPSNHANIENQLTQHKDELETLMNTSEPRLTPQMPVPLQQPQQIPFQQPQQIPFQQQPLSTGNNNSLIDGYSKEEIINKLNSVTNNNLPNGFNIYQLNELKNKLKNKLYNNSNLSSNDKILILQFLSNFRGGKHTKKHKRTKHKKHVKRQSKRKRKQFSKRGKPSAFLSRKA